MIVVIQVRISLPRFAKRNVSFFKSVARNLNIYLKSKREYVVICTIRYEFRSPPLFWRRKQRTRIRFHFFLKMILRIISTCNIEKLKRSEVWYGYLKIKKKLGRRKIRKYRA